MHRIVIELYDHTSDMEVDEILADIRGIGLDKAWVVREPDPALTDEQIAASEKVYRASQNDVGVELSVWHVRALWQRIHADAKVRRALRAP